MNPQTILLAALLLSGASLGAQSPHFSTARHRLQLTGGKLTGSFGPVYAQAAYGYRINRWLSADFGLGFATGSIHGSTTLEPGWSYSDFSPFVEDNPAQALIAFDPDANTGSLLVGSAMLQIALRQNARNRVWLGAGPFLTRLRSTQVGALSAQVDPATGEVTDGTAHIIYLRHFTDGGAAVALGYHYRLTQTFFASAQAGLYYQAYEHHVPIRYALTAGIGLHLDRCGKD